MIRYTAKEMSMLADILVYRPWRDIFSYIVWDDRGHPERLHKKLADRASRDDHWNKIYKMLYTRALCRIPLHIDDREPECLIAKWRLSIDK